MMKKKILIEMAMAKSQNFEVKQALVPQDGTEEEEGEGEDLFESFTTKEGLAEVKEKYAKLFQEIHRQLEAEQRIQLQGEGQELPPIEAPLTPTQPWPSQPPDDEKLSEEFRVGSLQAFRDCEEAFEDLATPELQKDKLRAGGKLGKGEQRKYLGEGEQEEGEQSPEEGEQWTDPAEKGNPNEDLNEDPERRGGEENSDRRTTGTVTEMLMKREEAKRLQEFERIGKDPRVANVELETSSPEQVRIKRTKIAILCRFAEQNPQIRERFPEFYIENCSEKLEEFAHFNDEIRKTLRSLEHEWVNPAQYFQQLIVEQDQMRRRVEAEFAKESGLSLQQTIETAKELQQERSASLDPMLKRKAEIPLIQKYLEQLNLKLESFSLLDNDVLLEDYLFVQPYDRAWVASEVEEIEKGNFEDTTTYVPEKHPSFRNMVELAQKMESHFHAFKDFFGFIKTVKISEQIEDEDRTRWLVPLHQVNWDLSFAGKVLPITVEDLQKVVPERLPKALQMDLATFGLGKGFQFMLSEQAMKVIEKLQAQKQSYFTDLQPTILDGDRGQGKSVALLEIVYWARQNGWLVVYIPDGLALTCSENKRQITPSRRDADLWDSPEIAAEICDSMVKVHAEMLKDIPARYDYSTTVLVDQKPKNLLELLQMGMSQPPVQNPSGKGTYVPTNELATDVVYWFRRELAMVNEYPVLIAVDDINSFWEPSTDLKDPRSVLDGRFAPSPIVPIEKLVLAQCFSHLHQANLANGVVVAATTSKALRERFNEAVTKRDNFVEIPVWPKRQFYRLMLQYKDTGLNIPSNLDMISEIPRTFPTMPKINEDEEVPDEVKTRKMAMVNAERDRKVPVSLKAPTEVEEIRQWNLLYNLSQGRGDQVLKFYQRALNREHKQRWKKGKRRPFNLNRQEIGARLEVRTDEENLLGINEQEEFDSSATQQDTDDTSGFNEQDDLEDLHDPYDHYDGVESGNHQDARL